MGKVSSSYGSVVLGVSEQVPQDRRSGQHKEQVNMMDDPVNGLARRHGSVLQQELVLTDYASLLWEAIVADTENHKEFTFFVGGVKYALIYRTRACDESVTDLSFAWCFNKDTRQFVPISYPEVDVVLDQLKAGGVSATVNVGKYIYLAGNTIVPSYTPTDTFGAAANKARLVAWIRGGAFSRTFKLTLTKLEGTTTVVSYKTKPASYPELLNTSDILLEDPPGTPNPNYQKQVNDRTNAYNSAVTAYIGEASQDITPENIAAKLRDQLVIAGVLNTEVIGSTVVINDPAYIEIDADDGGDGTLLRGVGNTISALELVSTVHYVGKVVRVRPNATKEDQVFYLKAIPKNETETGWAEVTWQETAGYSMQPMNVFIQGTVKNGTLYLASSASLLDGLTGDTNPTFKPNAVGDESSSPLPTMFGRGINYLGIFQDRLVIGTGSTLLFSRPGDYFNWFRVSALTIDDLDPIEAFALGAEDDVITSSSTFDRSLLLCGERKWYLVNGRQALTAKNASVPIVAEYEDGQLADPKNSGNLVFYATVRNGLTALHQVQTSAFADSPESINVSQQLKSYITGTPSQIITVTAPNIIFLRTRERRQELFLYAYLDNAAGTERIFDAWGRWLWDNDVGPMVGMTSDNGELLAFTLRHSVIGEDHKIYIACDKFVTDSGLSDKPYADSLRVSTNDTGFINPAAVTLNAVAAFDRTSEYHLLGSLYEDLPAFAAGYPEGSDAKIWAGISYPAFVTPTNPYIRDKNDKAVVNGRLTLGRIGVSVSDTAGLICDLETAQGTQRMLSFNGRVVGQSNNIIGRQPVVTTTVGCTIGKEVRECAYTLRAKTWLPLTITAISWVGQYFNNTRSV